GLAYCNQNPVCRCKRLPLTTRECLFFVPCELQTAIIVSIKTIRTITQLYRLHAASAMAAKLPMGLILKKMEQALNREKPPRLTALRGLQMEEQGDSFKILIGTILSARSRDENTTKVVNKLFTRFKTPQELAAADIDEIKKIIHSIGFFNVKAERIKQVSQMLVSKFAGKVPSDIDQLLELPGVGRKTANCVLVYAFNK